MKMTKTGSVSRSMRLGGKMILVVGASMLTAMACGGGDEGSGGDGDGDGDNPGTGGSVVGGTGGSGTGGAVIGGTGGIAGGTGGAAVVAPTTPGAAVATAIPAGTFAVDAMGFGTDVTNGFQGFAYTYTDSTSGGTSVIYPATFGMISETEVAEGKLCVNGTGAQVIDMEYSTYWGAGVGWNLNQAPEETATTPISVADFTGVTFTHVAAATAETRIVVNVGTQGYCKVIAAGENTVLWSELNSTCWDGMGDAFDPATMLVDNISFQIATNPTAPTPFDFCIGGLTFNGGGGMGGAPAL